LTQHEDEVRIEAVMDTSRVTGLPCVGSSVGKEDASELEALGFCLSTPMKGQMPPDEVYVLSPFKTTRIQVDKVVCRDSDQSL
jgi:hypothetical protein